VKRRALLDVSALPHEEFSHGAPIWWGNLLMCVIEGMAFALSIAAYFYIRRNFDTWPPEPTRLPTLAVATANLITLIVSILPYWYAARLARSFASPARIGSWLLVGVVLGLSSVVMRFYEFGAVHSRYDSNAYGSVVWLLLGMHLGHLVAGSLEPLAIAVLMFKGPVEEKHYVDVTVTAFYWYFVVISWLIIFPVVFLAPRFL
jgi:heme/copper-type cytochrome/quinol oxidase subunit 3